MLILLILLMIMILISIAFITLMERKVLGLIQNRLGPNKLLIKGLLQPMADGLKLFFKENLKNFSLNKYLFNIFPFINFFLMMLFWMIYNFKLMESMNYSMLFMIIISGLSVYCLFTSGWSSNSKYSLLGSYRSVAQTISYEVSLIFLLFSIFMIMNNYKLITIKEFEYFNMTMNFSLWFLFMMWLIIIVAELNRAPFDFAESESELVSGFNIEYGSSKFAFLFLAEYGNIIFMSYITIYMFNMSLYMFNMLIMLFMLIWIRGTYPRFRYDNLMYLNWKKILPNTLFICMIMFYMMIKI
uniref:NADH-ubiquinone oxidoreductase chain 1 n=1 Tax=Typhlodromus pineus TaxID=3061201 RepID=A0AAU6QDU7_9ACAR